MRRRGGEDDEIGRAAQGGRVGGGDDRRWQVDARQTRFVPPGLGDPCRRLRGVAQQGDRLDPGEQARQRRSPCPGPDDRDPRIGHQRGLRACPADAGLRPAAFPLAADAPPPLRGFLRRGSLTDERSRKTSRIGVPSNPNASRSRFSR